MRPPDAPPGAWPLLGAWPRWLQLPSPLPLRLTAWVLAAMLLALRETAPYLPIKATATAAANPNAKRKARAAKTATRSSVLTCIFHGDPSIPRRLGLPNRFHRISRGGGAHPPLQEFSPPGRGSSQVVANGHGRGPGAGHNLYSLELPGKSCREPPLGSATPSGRRNPPEQVVSRRAGEQ